MINMNKKNNINFLLKKFILKSIIKLLTLITILFSNILSLLKQYDYFMQLYLIFFHIRKIERKIEHWIDQKTKYDTLLKILIENYKTVNNINKKFYNIKQFPLFKKNIKIKVIYKNSKKLNLIKWEANLHKYLLKSKINTYYKCFLIIFFIILPGIAGYFFSWHYWVEYEYYNNYYIHKEFLMYYNNINNMYYYNSILPSNIINYNNHPVWLNTEGELYGSTYHNKFYKLNRKFFHINQIDIDLFDNIIKYNPSSVNEKNAPWIGEEANYFHGYIYKHPTKNIDDANWLVAKLLFTDKQINSMRIPIGRELTKDILFYFQDSYKFIKNKILSIFNLILSDYYSYYLIKFINYFITIFSLGIAPSLFTKIDYMTPWDQLFEIFSNTSDILWKHFYLINLNPQNKNTEYFYNNNYNYFNEFDTGWILISIENYNSLQEAIFFLWCLEYYNSVLCLILINICLIIYLIKILIKKYKIFNFQKNWILFNINLLKNKLILNKYKKINIKILFNLEIIIQFLFKIKDIINQKYKSSWKFLYYEIFIPIFSKKLQKIKNKLLIYIKLIIKYPLIFIKSSLIFLNKNIKLLFIINLFMYFKNIIFKLKIKKKIKKYKILNLYFFKNQILFKFKENLINNNYFLIFLFLLYLLKTNIIISNICISFLIFIFPLLIFLILNIFIIYFYLNIIITLGSKLLLLICKLLIWSFISIFWIFIFRILEFFMHDIFILLNLYLYNSKGDGLTSYFFTHLPFMQGDYSWIWNNWSYISDLPYEGISFFDFNIILELVFYYLFFIKPCFKCIIFSSKYISLITLTKTSYFFSQISRMYAGKINLEVKNKDLFPYFLTSRFNINRQKIKHFEFLDNWNLFWDKKIKDLEYKNLMINNVQGNFLISDSGYNSRYNYNAFTPMLSLKDFEIIVKTYFNNKQWHFKNYIKYLNMYTLHNKEIIDNIFKEGCAPFTIINKGNYSIIRLLTNNEFKKNNLNFKWNYYNFIKYETYFNERLIFNEDNILHDDSTLNVNIEPNKNNNNFNLSINWENNLNFSGPIERDSEARRLFSNTKTIERRLNYNITKMEQLKKNLNPIKKPSVITQINDHISNQEISYIPIPSKGIILPYFALFVNKIYWFSNYISRWNDVVSDWILYLANYWKWKYYRLRYIFKINEYFFEISKNDHAWLVTLDKFFNYRFKLQKIVLRYFNYKGSTNIKKLNNNLKKSNSNLLQVWKKSKLNTEEHKIYKDPNVNFKIPLKKFKNQIILNKSIKNNIPWILEDKINIPVEKYPGDLLINHGEEMINHEIFNFQDSILTYKNSLYSKWLLRIGYYNYYDRYNTNFNFNTIDNNNNYNNNELIWNPDIRETTSGLTGFSENDFDEADNNEKLNIKEQYIPPMSTNKFSETEINIDWLDEDPSNRNVNFDFLIYYLSVFFGFVTILILISYTEHLYIEKIYPLNTNWSTSTTFHITNIAPNNIYIWNEFPSLLYNLMVKDVELDWELNTPINRINTDWMLGQVFKHVPFPNWIHFRTISNGLFSPPVISEIFRNWQKLYILSGLTSGILESIYFFWTDPTDRIFSEMRGYLPAKYYGYSFSQNFGNTNLNFDDDKWRYIIQKHLPYWNLYPFFIENGDFFGSSLYHTGTLNKSFDYYTPSDIHKWRHFWSRARYIKIMSILVSSDSNYNHELLSYQFKNVNIGFKNIINLIKYNYINYIQLNFVKIENKSYELIDNDGSSFFFEKDLDLLYSNNNIHYLGLLTGKNLLFWYNHYHFKEFYHFFAKSSLNINTILQNKITPYILNENKINDYYKFKTNEEKWDNLNIKFNILNNNHLFYVKTYPYFRPIQILSNNYIFNYFTKTKYLMNIYGNYWKTENYYKDLFNFLNTSNFISIIDNSGDHWLFKFKPWSNKYINNNYWFYRHYARQFFILRDLYYNAIKENELNRHRTMSHNHYSWSEWNTREVVCHNPTIYKSIDFFHKYALTLWTTLNQEVIEFNWYKKWIPNIINVSKIHPWTEHHIFYKDNIHFEYFSIGSYASSDRLLNKTLFMQIKKWDQRLDYIDYLFSFQKFWDISRLHADSVFDYRRHALGYIFIPQGGHEMHSNYEHRQKYLSTNLLLAEKFNYKSDRLFLAKYFDQKYLEPLNTWSIFWNMLEIPNSMQPIPNTSYSSITRGFKSQILPGDLVNDLFFLIDMLYYIFNKFIHIIYILYLDFFNLTFFMKSFKLFNNDIIIIYKMINNIINLWYNKMIIIINENNIYLLDNFLRINWFIWEKWINIININNVNILIFFNCIQFKLFNWELMIKILFYLFIYILIILISIFILTYYIFKFNLNLYIKYIILYPFKFLFGYKYMIILNYIKLYNLKKIWFYIKYKIKLNLFLQIKYKIEGWKQLKYFIFNFYIINLIYYFIYNNELFKKYKYLINRLNLYFYIKKIIYNYFIIPIYILFKIKFKIIIKKLYYNYIIIYKPLTLFNNSTFKQNLEERGLNLFFFKFFWIESTIPVFELHRINQLIYLINNILQPQLLFFRLNQTLFSFIKFSKIIPINFWNLSKINLTSDLKKLKLFQYDYRLNYHKQYYKYNKYKLLLNNNSFELLNDNFYKKFKNYYSIYYNNIILSYYNKNNNFIKKFGKYPFLIFKANDFHKNNKYINKYINILNKSIYSKKNIFNHLIAPFNLFFINPKNYKYKQYLNKILNIIWFIHNNIIKKFNIIRIPIILIIYISNYFYLLIPNQLKIKIIYLKTEYINIFSYCKYIILISLKCIIFSLKFIYMNFIKPFMLSSLLIWKHKPILINKLWNKQFIKLNNTVFHKRIDNVIKFYINKHIFWEKKIIPDYINQLLFGSFFTINIKNLYNKININKLYKLNLNKNQIKLKGKNLNIKYNIQYKNYKFNQLKYNLYIKYKIFIPKFLAFKKIMSKTPSNLKYLIEQKNKILESINFKEILEDIHALNMYARIINDKYWLNLDNIFKKKYNDQNYNFYKIIDENYSLTDNSLFKKKWSKNKIKWNYNQINTDIFASNKYYTWIKTKPDILLSIGRLFDWPKFFLIPFYNRWFKQYILIFFYNFLSIISPFYWRIINTFKTTSHIKKKDIQSYYNLKNAGKSEFYQTKESYKIFNQKLRNWYISEKSSFNFSRQAWHFKYIYPFTTLTNNGFSLKYKILNDYKNIKYNYKLNYYFIPFNRKTKLKYNLNKENMLIYNSIANKKIIKYLFSFYIIRQFFIFIKFYLLLINLIFKFIIGRYIFSYFMFSINYKNQIPNIFIKQEQKLKNNKNYIIFNNNKLLIFLWWLEFKWIKIKVWWFNLNKLSYLHYFNYNNKLITLPIIKPLLKFYKIPIIINILFLIYFILINLFTINIIWPINFIISIFSKSIIDLFPIIEFYTFSNNINNLLLLYFDKEHSGFLAHFIYYIHFIYNFIIYGPYSPFNTVNYTNTITNLAYQEWGCYYQNLNKTIFNTILYTTLIKQELTLINILNENGWFYFPYYQTFVPLKWGFYINDDLKILVGDLQLNLLEGIFNPLAIYGRINPFGSVLTKLQASYGNPDSWNLKYYANSNHISELSESLRNNKGLKSTGLNNRNLFTNLTNSWSSSLDFPSTLRKRNIFKLQQDILPFKIMGSLNRIMSSLQTVPSWCDWTTTQLSLSKRAPAFVMIPAEEEMYRTGYSMILKNGLWVWADMFKNLKISNQRKGWNDISTYLYQNAIKFTYASGTSYPYELKYEYIQTLINQIVTRARKVGFSLEYYNDLAKVPVWQKIFWFDHMSSIWGPIEEYTILRNYPISNTGDSIVGFKYNNIYTDLRPVTVSSINFWQIDINNLDAKNWEFITKHLAFNPYIKFYQSGLMSDNSIWETNVDAMLQELFYIGNKLQILNTQTTKNSYIVWTPYSDLDSIYLAQKDNIPFKIWKKAELNLYDPIFRSLRHGSNRILQLSERAQKQFWDIMSSKIITPNYYKLFKYKLQDRLWNEWAGERPRLSGAFYLPGEWIIIENDLKTNIQFNFGFDYNSRTLYFNDFQLKHRGWELYPKKDNVTRYMKILKWSARLQRINPFLYFPQIIKDNYFGNFKPSMFHTPWVSYYHRTRLNAWGKYHAYHNIQAWNIIETRDQKKLVKIGSPWMYNMYVFGPQHKTEDEYNFQLILKDPIVWSNVSNNSSYRKNLIESTFHYNLVTKWSLFNGKPKQYKNILHLNTNDIFEDSTNMRRQKIWEYPIREAGSKKIIRINIFPPLLFGRGKPFLHEIVLPFHYYLDDTKNLLRIDITKKDNTNLYTQSRKYPQRLYKLKPEADSAFYIYHTKLQDYVDGIFWGKNLDFNKYLKIISYRHSHRLNELIDLTYNIHQKILENENKFDTQLLFDKFWTFGPRTNTIEDVIANRLVTGFKFPQFRIPTDIIPTVNPKILPKFVHQFAILDDDAEKEETKNFLNTKENSFQEVMFRIQYYQNSLSYYKRAHLLKNNLFLNYYTNQYIWNYKNILHQNANIWKSRIAYNKRFLNRDKFDAYWPHAMIDIKNGKINKQHQVSLPFISLIYSDFDSFFYPIVNLEANAKKFRADVNPNRTELNLGLWRYNLKTGTLNHSYDWTNIRDIALNSSHQKTFGLDPHNSLSIRKSYEFTELLYNTTTKDDITRKKELPITSISERTRIVENNYNVTQLMSFNDHTQSIGQYGNINTKGLMNFSKSYKTKYEDQILEHFPLKFIVDLFYYENIEPYLSPGIFNQYYNKRASDLVVSTYNQNPTNDYVITLNKLNQDEWKRHYLILDYFYMPGLNSDSYLKIQPYTSDFNLIKRTHEKFEKELIDIWEGTNFAKNNNDFINNNLLTQLFTNQHTKITWWNYLAMGAIQDNPRRYWYNIWIENGYNRRALRKESWYYKFIESRQLFMHKPLKITDNLWNVTYFMDMMEYKFNIWKNSYRFWLNYDINKKLGSVTYNTKEIKLFFNFYENFNFLKDLKEIININNFNLKHLIFIQFNNINFINNNTYNFKDYFKIQLPKKINNKNITIYPTNFIDSNHFNKLLKYQYSNIFKERNKLFYNIYIQDITNIYEYKQNPINLLTNEGNFNLKVNYYKDYFDPLYNKSSATKLEGQIYINTLFWTRGFNKKELIPKIKHQKDLNFFINDHNINFLTSTGKEMFTNYLISVYEPYFNYLYYHSKNFAFKYSETYEVYSYDQYLSSDSHIRNFYNFMNARQHNYNLNLWYLDDEVFIHKFKHDHILKLGYEILKK